MKTHEWLGQQFRYYPANTIELPDKSGVYVFAKRMNSTLGSILAGSSGWEALYIGETGSFKTRLTPDHEKWSDAEALGFTHIHIHHTGTLSRIVMQRFMIAKYEPILNKQGKG